MSCNHCKMRILQYLFVTSARYMIKIVPCSTLGTRPLTKIQLVILNLHIKQLNSSLFSTAPNTCMQNWQSDMEFVEYKKMNTARNLWQPEKTRSNCRKNVTLLFIEDIIQGMLFTSTGFFVKKIKRANVSQNYSSYQQWPSTIATKMRFTLPFCYLLLTRDQGNQTIHTLTVPAHGNAACDFQSTR